MAAEQSTITKKRRRGEAIHAAQCGECFKWRVITTREEFEDIRSKLIEDPFVCSKKKGGSSCEDPGDIEYDSSRIWAIEKPGLPKTPVGFKNELIIRNNLSKFDSYFITPTGEKLKGPSGIASYLKQHPEFDDRLSVSNFNFTNPKIMADTLSDISPKKKKKIIIPRD
ncbi:methyl-CpG-binding domain-containing protein 4 [Impatiens glandulifera]|uniref:methyl-CpG-binding domain-containing protein 4 n=1 Tax=Impatiens glandulifera TaxID=253017 RepID=UPI001FB0E450|nr:methyl-CpG-binding domain-containing protein 4 [Impatiens glandulifera]